MTVVDKNELISILEFHEEMINDYIKTAFNKYQKNRLKRYRSELRRQKDEVISSDKNIFSDMLDAYFIDDFDILEMILIEIDPDKYFWKWYKDYQTIDEVFEEITKTLEEDLEVIKNGKKIIVEL